MLSSRTTALERVSLLAMLTAALKNAIKAALRIRRYVLDQVPQNVCSTRSLARAALA